LLYKAKKGKREVVLSWLKMRGKDTIIRNSILLIEQKATKVKRFSMYNLIQLA